MRAAGKTNIRYWKTGRELERARIPGKIGEIEAHLKKKEMHGRVLSRKTLMAQAEALKEYVELMRAINRRRRSGKETERRAEANPEAMAIIMKRKGRCIGAIRKTIVRAKKGYEKYLQDSKKFVKEIKRIEGLIRSAEEKMKSGGGQKYAEERQNLENELKRAVLRERNARFFAGSVGEEINVLEELLDDVVTARKKLDDVPVVGGKVFVGYSYPPFPKPPKTEMSRIIGGLPDKLKSMAVENPYFNQWFMRQELKELSRKKKNNKQ